MQHAPGKCRKSMDKKPGRKVIRRGIWNNEKRNNKDDKALDDCCHQRQKENNN